MLKKQKERMLKSKNKNLLDELILEESELKASITHILFWTYNSIHPDLSRAHIISYCKKMLFVLNRLDKKVEKQFPGPATIVKFPHMPSFTHKPRQLAKVFGAKSKLVRTIKNILKFMHHPRFKFTKEAQAVIHLNCRALYKELEADEKELGLALELAGVDNPYRKN